MKRDLKSVNWTKLLPPVIILIVAFISYSTFSQFVDDEFLLQIGMSVIYLLGGWVISKVINILINHHMRRHDFNKSNNLHERSVQTRIRYVKTLSNIIIFLVSIALALRQFQGMRELSTSILASAGVAGIILAFSAQKLLANILAGFEIAFTQPIRLDDVVVVEGEWGRIEEINTTHVVVKIWDQRRLVLPITYFVSEPFQNWTKTSSAIWGTCEFYVDYHMPIGAMRKQLTKILKSTELWDGKIDSLQVTDTTDKIIKVRALMSAKDSATAWDLRCYVREKMIDFLQKKYPQHLPKLRAEVTT